MTVDPNCTTCGFSRATTVEGDDPIRECRRYPPQCLIIGVEGRQTFPTVDDTMWCGEHWEKPT